MSQEKGQMAMEWNRLRTEKTAQLEELRRESEKINRERFSIEQEFGLREAKLKYYYVLISFLVSSSSFFLDFRSLDFFEFFDCSSFNYHRFLLM